MIAFFTVNTYMYIAYLTSPALILRVVQHISVLLSSVTFRDPTNQAVSYRLAKEVHGLNPTFDAADIRSKLAQWYSDLLYIIQFPLSPCFSTSCVHILEDTLSRTVTPKEASVYSAKETTKE